MKRLSHNFCYLLLAVSVVITNTASALQSESGQTRIFYQMNNGVPSNSIAHKPQGYLEQYRAENKQRYLSKRQAIRQVKKRYDAEVLRINFDAQRELYRVKILTGKGRVKFVTVDARY